MCKSAEAEPSLETGYGEEWADVREHAVETLSLWHQETPHKWPLQVVMDTWEELHWRFLEEIKELVRQIKKQAKRESLTLQELRFYALLPGPDGAAWLQLPRTFDLLNPEGWFKTELEPRIERKQERTLWRLTWDGAEERGVCLRLEECQETKEIDSRPLSSSGRSSAQRRSTGLETGHLLTRMEFCYAGRT